MIKLVRRDWGCFTLAAFFVMLALLAGASGSERWAWIPAMVYGFCYSQWRDFEGNS